MSSSAGQSALTADIVFFRASRDRIAARFSAASCISPPPHELAREGPSLTPLPALPAHLRRAVTDVASHSVTQLIKHGVGVPRGDDGVLQCRTVENQVLAATSTLNRVLTDVLTTIEKAFVFRPRSTHLRCMQDLLASVEIVVESCSALSELLVAESPDDRSVPLYEVAIGASTTALLHVIAAMNDAALWGTIADAPTRLERCIELADASGVAPDSITRGTYINAANVGDSLGFAAAVLDSATLPACIAACGEEGRGFVERWERSHSQDVMTTNSARDVGPASLHIAERALHGLSKRLSVSLLVLGLALSWRYWSRLFYSKVAIGVAHGPHEVLLDALHQGEVADLHHTYASLRWAAVEVRWSLVVPRTTDWSRLHAAGGTVMQDQQQAGDAPPGRTPQSEDVVATHTSLGRNHPDDLLAVRRLYAVRSRSRIAWTVSTSVAEGTSPFVELEWTPCIEDADCQLNAVSVTFATRCASPAEVQLTLADAECAPVLGAATVLSSHAPRTPVLVELFVPLYLGRGTSTLRLRITFVAAPGQHQLSVLDLEMHWSSSHTSFESQCAERRLWRPCLDADIQSALDRLWLRVLPLRRILIQQLQILHVTEISEDAGAHELLESHRTETEAVVKKLKGALWGSSDGPTSDGASLLTVALRIVESTSEPCTVAFLEQSGPLGDAAALFGLMKPVLRSLGLRTTPVNLLQARDVKHRWSCFEMTGTAADTVLGELSAFVHLQPDATGTTPPDNIFSEFLTEDPQAASVSCLVLRGADSSLDPEVGLLYPGIGVNAIPHLRKLLDREHVVFADDAATLEDMSLAALVHCIFATHHAEGPDRFARLSLLLACGLEDYDRDFDRSGSTRFMTTRQALAEQPRNAVTLHSCRQRIQTALNALRPHMATDSDLRRVVAVWLVDHEDVADALKATSAWPLPSPNHADTESLAARMALTVTAACCVLQWAPKNISDTDVLSQLRDKLTSEVDPSLEDQFALLAHAIARVTPVSVFLTCGHCLCDGAFQRRAHDFRRSQLNAFGKHLILPSIDHRGVPLPVCRICRISAMAGWSVAMLEHPAVAAASTG